MPRPSRSSGAAVRPTVRGWGFLGVALLFVIASTLIDRREGLFIGALLFTLVLASGLSVWMVRPRVAVRRRFAEPAVAAGETARVQVVIEATGSARGLNRWKEQLPDGFPEQSGELWAAGSDPRRFGGMVEYRVRAPRRGRYPIGPLWLGYGDPLGLTVALRPAGDVSSLVVTPRVTVLDQPGVLTASGEGGRHQLYVPSNPRADELIAREYRAGDPLRRVHWRQTARRGELMVRQEEQQGDPEACVVLDTTQLARSTSGLSVADAERDFERAVEAAASVAVRLLSDGYALTLIETATPAVTGAGSAKASAGAGSGSGSASGSGARADRGAGSIATPPRVRHYTPGGAASLLMDLADVRRVAVGPDDDTWSHVDAQLRSLGAVVPVFCLLTEGGTASPTRVASLRGLADPAVALVAGTPVARVVAGSSHPTPVSLRDALLAAGWRAAQLTPDRSLDEAWRQIAVGAPAGGASR